MEWYRLDLGEGGYPAAKRGHTATCVAPGRMIIFGGDNTHQRQNELLVLAPDPQVGAIMSAAESNCSILI